MKFGAVINNRYEIISELGRGGMGIVYLARHRVLERDVAIKILSQSVSSESALRAQREGHALGNIKHPNLVAVYALEQDEHGHLMLIFDYIPGIPLNDILRDKIALAPDQAAVLFAQLCSGLQTLHQAGFVHRDIKPSNLMIAGTTDGAAPHLVIIDFGLVKSTDGDPPSSVMQKITSTGAVLGTPLYMSPEQFASASVSPRSDNYSAACVLYEMLTGSPPFTDESLYVVATSHMHEPPPAVPATLPNHQALNAFFANALAKSPSDRHASAEDMNREFIEAVKGRAQAPPTRKVPKRIARKELEVGARSAIICAFAAICLGGVLATHNEPTKAPLDYDAAENRAAVVYNEANQLKTNSDPASIAYLASAISDLESNYERRGPKMASVYQLYALLLILPDSHYPPPNFTKAVDALIKAKALVQNGSSRDRWNASCSLFKTLDYDSRWAEAYNEMQNTLALKHWKVSDMEGLDEASGTHVMERSGKLRELVQLYRNQEDHLALPEVHGYGPGGIRRDVALAEIWNGHPEAAVKLLSRVVYFANDNEGGHQQQLDVPVGLAASALARDERAFAKWQTYAPNQPMLCYKWTYATTVPAAHAVHCANNHRDTDARKLIDSIIAAEPLPAPNGEIVRVPMQNVPDKKREYLFALFLCKEASKRLGDSEREAKCTNRIKQINDELVKQNRIFPGVFS